MRFKDEGGFGYWGCQSVKGMMKMIGLKWVGKEKGWGESEKSTRIFLFGQTHPNQILRLMLSFSRSISLLLK